MGYRLWTVGDGGQGAGGGLDLEWRDRNLAYLTGELDGGENTAWRSRNRSPVAWVGGTGGSPRLASGRDYRVGAV